MNQVKKIKIKTNRELTDEEIKKINEKEIVFDTVTHSTGGHYDKFAGIRISSTTSGAHDNVACVITTIRPLEDKNNEYEITIEETESIQGLSRVHVGGRLGGYNLPPKSQYLEFLRNTEIAEFLDEDEISEQIKKIYEQEQTGDYYTTYEFSKGYSDVNIIIQRIVDRLDDDELRKNMQVNNGEHMVNAKLVDQYSPRKYEFVKFPCRAILGLYGTSSLKFMGIASGNETIEQPMNDVLEKIAKIRAINKKTSNARISYNYHKFIFPRLLESENDIIKFIEEVPSIELDDYDTDSLSLDEINSLVGYYECTVFFREYINSHDIKQIFQKIDEIKDINLKINIISEFSKHTNNFDKTENEKKYIQNILYELLSDEKGWKDNADIIANFSEDIKGFLSFDEKMELLKKSIKSNNMYCMNKYSSNLHKENELEISKLINNFFSDEEQQLLIEELLKQKDYQAMILIIRECMFNNKTGYQGKCDQYSHISVEQKNKMAEEIMNSDIEFYGIEYMSDYKSYLENKSMIDAVNKLAGSSAFYIAEYDMNIDINKGEQLIECFYDRLEKIVGYINVEKAIELVKNGKIHIDIPEKYIGMMIGKQGKNIQRIQDELSRRIKNTPPIKIILHPQKEGTTITLAQIEQAIEEQKSQMQGK